MSEQTDLDAYDYVHVRRDDGMIGFALRSDVVHLRQKDGTMGFSLRNDSMVGGEYEAVDTPVLRLLSALRAAYAELDAKDALLDQQGERLVTTAREQRIVKGSE